jgi:hypothetical protein
MVLTGTSGIGSATVREAVEVNAFPEATEEAEEKRAQRSEAWNGK